jgi:flagellar motility protein MotE (MotC chaperone)
MRKAIYIFLTVFILSFIIWSLNLLGIFTLDDMIVKTPFIQERLKTAEQYETLTDEYNILEQNHHELIDEKDQLERQLSIAQSTVTEQEATIASLKKELENITAITTDENLKNEKLANVYSEMDPTISAEILNELALETSLNIIKQLDEEKIAQIMTNMSREKAATITEQLKE